MSKNDTTSSMPVTLVIFGASGDLTHRKLIPSLFELFKKGRLPRGFRAVGYSRSDLTHKAFRDSLRAAMGTAGGARVDEAAWGQFRGCIFYHRGDVNNEDDVLGLKGYLAYLESGFADRVYYLATAPEIYPVIAKSLGAAGMAVETKGSRRIVVEKPFGADLASAVALNEALNDYFSESQIFRMDHYLGKEPAQNVLFFRFANTIFEPLWNRDYINNVQISVLEDLDVGRRGVYYDNAGIPRDMFQSHLMQLLALVAMESPGRYEADAVRDEKLKVFRAIRPIALGDSVRGQYRGYREAKGVGADSQTATYGAIKLFVDNPRWQGVPFFLRSGKALAQKTTEIDVEFACPPYDIFDIPPFPPNLLSLCIDPDEGFHIKFQAKVPGQAHRTQTANMAFHYSSICDVGTLPDAYERLLLDVIDGDQALFPRMDGIEQTWRITDPLIEQWESPDAPRLAIYEKGSAGPDEADELLDRDGLVWRLGCGKAEAG